MATSESSDEVEALLSMATEVVPGSTTLHLAGLANLDGNIITEVSMSELKPIVMTMANMANIVEDSSMVPVPEPVNDIQISDRSETVLASHLLSVIPSTSRPRIHQSTSEVYRDSTTGVTYEIHRGGTRRGGDKLIDSLGFTYNLKAGKGNKNISYWWCAVRNQQLRCPASVTQKGNTFMRGKRKHEHLVGQSTPKPSQNQTVPQSQSIKRGRPVGSLKGIPSGVSRSNSNYKIIKNGSKAGMDLLKDRLGYTYTLKKASIDGTRIQWRCSVRNKYLRCPASAHQTGLSIMPGNQEHLHTPGFNRRVIGGGLKTYWCCSVRNKHLRCPASVIQYVGNQFSEGSFDHKHLPTFNIPASPHENIPSLRQLKKHIEFDESEYEYEEEEETDHSYGQSKSAAGSATGTKYLNSGKFSSSNNKSKISLSREKKRREHQTFLGPRCTINLTKCDDPDCNCRLVHCPFCDKHHFKPTKAGRVQDHLELTHFAHGVQYDDLMIVKCFHDCDLDKSYGHYHCVFCFRQMLKRTAYARHMLRHMTKMGIPARLLVLPDSKFPDIINAYGYEIPICKKASCAPPNQEKHYHCPNCSQMCRERSLTVNHLWRCLQRKREGSASEELEEDTTATVDEDLLMLHFSHAKSFKDIPIDKCMSIDCCHQKYHCKLCPENVFMPTYRQHLIAHYITHWKQRVLYKNYSILKCFHPCDGVDRSMCKTRYHYHCPICRKIILTKGTFEDHLKTCHMFRFGENLIQRNKAEFDESFQDDIMMSQESAPLNENVDFMEDQLTSQAIMNAERNKRGRVKSRAKNWKGAAKSKKNKKRVVKQESEEEETDDDDDDEIDDEEDEEEEEEEEEPRSGQIVENDVYELCSAVISPKLAKKVKSTSHLKSILGGVAGATRVKLSSDRGQYLLTGPAMELLEAQKMLTKSINKQIKGGKSSLQSQSKLKVTLPVSASKKKKPVISPKKLEVKRGRGRPKKDTSGDGDSFPYSEIRQIIEASKDSSDETPKRGRGRPSKKNPAKSLVETKSVTVSSSSTRQSGASIKVEKSSPPPKMLKTPGRYSTRGVRQNYLEMSSGGFKREIKQEPVSELEDAYESVVETSPRKRSKAPKRRGRPRKVQIDQEDEDIEEDTEEHYNKKGNEIEDVDEERRENEELNGSAEEFENEELNEEEEDMDDSLSLFDDSEDEFIDGEDDGEDEMKDMETEEEGMRSVRVTDSAVKRLKTTNVTSQVPSVFKLGMRKSNLPKPKLDKDGMDKSQVTEAVLECEKADNKCSLCEDYTAESFADLTEHLKVFHHVYDPPRCDTCEIDFDTTQSLDYHIERKHGPLPEKVRYTCDYPECGKIFMSENGLLGHYNRIHLGAPETPKQKRYSCHKCEYKCNSTDDMFEHKRVEHDEPIQCEICNKNFMNSQSLKSHCQLIHNAVSVACTMCNKTFSNKSYLSKHMKSHVTPSFKCDICNKILRSNYSLKVHLETHKDPSERTYKYMCSYCGKRFALKSNLDDHINKHTGSRPYKCDICQKRFGFRSMLMKHKTYVHSSERPFTCGFCKKGFKFMNLLQNHMTTHTNTSKHICPHCSKSFCTASTMRFHSKKCGGLIWKRTPVLPAQQGTLLVFTEAGTNNPVEEVDPNSDVIPEIQGIQYIVSQEAEVQMDYTTVEGTETSAVQEIETVFEEPVQTIAEAPLDAPLEEPLEQQQQQVEAESGQCVVEVYACSECKATFNTYTDAETHVLTAHSAVAAQQEETLEVGNC